MLLFISILFKLQTVGTKRRHKFLETYFVVKITAYFQMKKFFDISAKFIKINFYD